MTPIHPWKKEKADFALWFPSCKPIFSLQAGQDHPRTHRKSIPCSSDCLFIWTFSQNCWPPSTTMVLFYTPFPVVQKVCPSSTPWAEPFWHMDPFSANYPLLQLLDPLPRTADHPLQWWSCLMHYSCHSVSLSVLCPIIWTLLACGSLFCQSIPCSEHWTLLSWLLTTLCNDSFTLCIVPVVLWVSLSFPFLSSVKMHSGYSGCFLLLLTHWNIYLEPQLRL